MKNVVISRDESGLVSENIGVEILLVRIMALFFLANLTAFHKAFLDAGSNPELGSSR
jgi:hypothetical protein